MGSRPGSGLGRGLWVLIVHVLAAAWTAEMFDPLHCDEKGAKEVVRPSEPFLCPRSGTINGVRLKEECERALSNIVEGVAEQGVYPQQSPYNTDSRFCRPGRDVNLVKSEFTCYCTDKKQWDCHKGVTPLKPMPGYAKRPSARSMLKVPRKCEADMIIHKMYTDFCNTYGSYVTYDDCIYQRNRTITVQSLPQRDTPVVCLPGTYTIYMHCHMCRCFGGVFQQECEIVDCPWAKGT